MATQQYRSRAPWVLLIAGLAVVALMLVLIWVTTDNDDEDTASPSATPTWDMTAQPVPNQYGSVGAFDEQEVAGAWVQAFYSWKEGEPEPAGMLSRVRDWTTDDLFGLLVDKEIPPPDWAEAHGAVPSRTVEIIRSEATVGNHVEDESVDVTFRTADIAEGGNPSYGQQQTVRVVFAEQPVTVADGGTDKQVMETRVRDVYEDVPPAGQQDEQEGQ